MILGVADAVAEARLRSLGFSTRWVRTRAGRMRVAEARGPGTGPPLVLLHGVGSRASDLCALLQRIRGASPHIVVPDLPGHGRSERPAGGMAPATLTTSMFELLDAVVPAQAVVFGNSLGGLVAVRYARARPDRVRALVLASPAGAPMSEARLTSFLARFNVDDPLVAKRFVDSVFHRAPAPMLFMRSGLQARLRSETVIDLLKRIQPSDLLDAAEIETVLCPVVLIWGDAERLLSESDLAFFMDHLGGPVRMIRLARAGHAPFVEAPGAVAGVLQEALLEVDAPPSPGLSSRGTTDY